MLSHGQSPGQCSPSIFKGFLPCLRAWQFPSLSATFEDQVDEFQPPDSKHTDRIEPEHAFEWHSGESFWALKCFLIIFN